MLSRAFPREALFACPRLSPWNSPFLSVELTLSTPCSSSCQGAVLGHRDSLPPHDSVIWTTDFAYFLLAKAGCSNVLINCSLCGTRTILSFSAGPVCSSFSAEACAIVQALRWSWQHQQVCSFSFPPLRLSPHCVLFRLQTLWYICFTIRLRRVCGNTFLPANDAADELASEGGLLLQFLVVSLLPLFSTLFSDWRRTVSS